MKIVCIVALFAVLSCTKDPVEPGPPIQLSLDSPGTDTALAITVRSCSRFATEFGPYDSVTVDLTAVDPTNTVRVTDTAFAMNVARLRAELEKKTNSPDVLNRGDVWLDELKSPRAGHTPVVIGIAIQTNPTGDLYRFTLTATQLRDAREFFRDLDARCQLSAATRP